VRRLADRAIEFDRWLLVLAPGLIAIAMLFVWPLVGIASRSVTEPTIGLHNFERFIESPLAMRSLIATVSMAAVATAACAAIGYPYAYLMATAGGRWALVLGAIVLIPTAVSFLVRAFAMQLLLWDTGVINGVLRDLGLIDGPLPLIRNHASVVIAMTALLLPMFVLPAYSVMRRIDPDYVRAATVLGASPFRSFVRIFIPLSMPGVAAGSLLVFVISLGYYITPALFGDGRTLYLGELIVYYTTRLDWGLSSAVSLVLLVATLVVVWVSSRLVGFEDVFGVEVDR
jgi:ABC-type spermidine/putrescine transport system permease subunit I